MRSRWFPAARASVAFGTFGNVVRTRPARFRVNGATASSGRSLIVGRATVHARATSASGTANGMIFTVATISEISTTLYGARVATVIVLVDGVEGIELLSREDEHAARGSEDVDAAHRCRRDGHMRSPDGLGDTARRLVLADVTGLEAHGDDLEDAGRGERPCVVLGDHVPLLEHRARREVVT